MLTVTKGAVGVLPVSAQLVMPALFVMCLSRRRVYRQRLGAADPPKDQIRPPLRNWLYEARRGSDFWGDETDLAASRASRDQVATYHGHGASLFDLRPMSLCA